MGAHYGHYMYRPNNFFVRRQTSDFAHRRFIHSGSDVM